MWNANKPCFNQVVRNQVEFIVNTIDKPFERVSLPLPASWNCPVRFSSRPFARKYSFESVRPHASISRAERINGMIVQRNESQWTIYREKISIEYGVIDSYFQAWFVQIFERLDSRRWRLQQSDNVRCVTCVEKHQYGESHNHDNARGCAPWHHRCTLLACRAENDEENVTDFWS